MSSWEEENDIFTKGCTCHWASPMEREEDHDSAASFLPFQKLPMQQIKQVSRSTGGGRIWVLTFPPCQPAWEQRPGQPDVDFGQHPLSSSASSSLEQRRSKERHVLPLCLWLRCQRGQHHAHTIFGKELPALQWVTYALTEAGREISLWIYSNLLPQPSSSCTMVSRTELKIRNITGCISFAIH